MLTGCATTATSDITCDEKNWQAFGEKMATLGRAARTIEKYKESCGNQFTEQSLSDYLDGYDKGLVEFCSYDNGYLHGSQNIPKSDICPFKVRGVYLKGHAEGNFQFKEKHHYIEKQKQNEEMQPRNTETTEQPGGGTSP